MGIFTTSIRKIGMKYVGTWFADRLRQPGWQNNLVEGLQGVHRTDIALCLYWVFYAADKGIAPPPLRGYLKEKGRKPDKIIRTLNEFYRCKTERDGANPIPEEVFKERKDFICIMNKNDNQ